MIESATIHPASSPWSRSIHTIHASTRHLPVVQSTHYWKLFAIRMKTEFRPMTALTITIAGNGLHAQKLLYQCCICAGTYTAVLAMTIKMVLWMVLSKWSCTRSYANTYMGCTPYRSVPLVLLPHYV